MGEEEGRRRKNKTNIFLGLDWRAVSLLLSLGRHNVQSNPVLFYALEQSWRRRTLKQLFYLYTAQRAWSNIGGGGGHISFLSFFLFSFSAHFDFLFDINRIRLGSNKGFVIRQRTYRLTGRLVCFTSCPCFKQLWKCPEKQKGTTHALWMDFCCWRREMEKGEKCQVSWQRRESNGEEKRNENLEKGSNYFGRFITLFFPTQSRLS